MEYVPPSLIQPTSYPAPRKNVLLLTCMDLRLLDDTVRFMNHDNLTNRYDHVVFAGAALGALGAPGACGDHSHWRKCFFEHLGAAVTLHGIEDVYILEHRNCGAYSKVFEVAPDYGNSDEDQIAEAACHLKYAQMLESEIHAWAKQQAVALSVKKFLMDLRGCVSLLEAPQKKAKARKKS